VRRGFSLVEVLVAAVVVACGLVPLLGMFSQQTRVASVNKYQVLARARAKRILDGLSALEYDTLARLAADAGEAAGLPTVLPPPEEELKAMLGDAFGDEHRHLVGTMALYTEGVTWAEVDPRGLARLDVRMSWRSPADPPTTPAHTLTVSRFVARQEASRFVHSTIRQG